MRWHSFSAQDFARAVGVGIGVSILTAAVMVTALKSGVSPLPKPLGLAFAETVLGRPLPLPMGLLFHTAWVTAFSVIYVGLFRDALTFVRALALGAVLWILVLVFFFPLVGWGFLGLAVTPKLIAASAVPHILFAVLLWGACRLAFQPSPTARSVSGKLSGEPLRRKKATHSGMPAFCRPFIVYHFYRRSRPALAERHSLFD